MSRSKMIAMHKNIANDLGHDMGNVVNISPYFCFAGVQFSVLSRCRTCGKTLEIVQAGGMVWVRGEALLLRCPVVWIGPDD